MTDSPLPPLPELLAPAGSPACALAAFDAGADAVYAGLAKFNARERGENFTPERMGAVIDYAHKLGRKVYLTLNTLIREAELPEIVETLALLEELGPDALLVQDLGIVRIAREYFPRLVLHGSTQMGIHNAPGFAAARKLGLSRVVLERQVTLEELAAIRKQTDLEIEVFIHGALCCSLSGACWLSSWLGGYSGNRGKCKQPCRRRYYSARGNGFFLSPQDLCGAELIPELRKQGVASLKIEGRLRQPDYVRSIVQAYRMLLDVSHDAGKFAEALPQARNLLSKGCGRRWSRGFYSKDSMRELIKFDSIGAAGQRCGSVEELRGNGFGFTTAKRLFLGDRLRVQPVSGEDGVSLTLTKFFTEGLPSRKALPGEKVFICCDKQVPEHGLVFKIGESFPDYEKRLESLPERRERVDLEAELSHDKLTVRAVNTPLPEWSVPLQLAKAERHPADAEQLKAVFSASDSPVFALGDFTLKCSEELFFPAPELKKVRRDFWDFVSQNLRAGQTVRRSGEALEKFHRKYCALKPDYFLPDRLTETVALKPHGAEPADRRAIRADGIFDVNQLTGEAILPEFCPEDRIPALRRAIAAAYKGGIRRFRVTSLYGFILLRDYEDLQLTASAPLPVCNSMAAQELLETFGISKAMIHPELARSDMEELHKHATIPLECYRLGRPALLTSRAPLPLEGAFRDARGNEFEARTDQRDHLSRVFARQVLSLPRLEGIYDFYDLRNATWRNAEENTSSFNFDSSWA